MVILGVLVVCVMVTAVRLKTLGRTASTRDVTGASTSAVSGVTMAGKKR